MAIYAHRGASIEFPENTLAAFRRAIEVGAPGAELDVHLTKDGEAVVIHDETVDRTTNGRGWVQDLTLADIRDLDAGDGERIPTLAEVLELCEGKLVLDIEVKEGRAAAKVLEELARFPDQRWLISSFVWSSLRYVRDHAPDAELWVLWPSATDEAIAFGKKVGATVLNLEYRTVDADTVARVREAGMDVGVWTVNDRAEAERFRDLGVVDICTDDPASLLTVYP
jgi:glycerophosphoryl diester phosphodiesterase